MKIKRNPAIAAKVAEMKAKEAQEKDGTPATAAANGDSKAANPEESKTGDASGRGIFKFSGGGLLPSLNNA